MGGRGSSRPTTRRRRWTAVLAANLPVPSLLGWICTENGGRVGMVAGVGLIWLLGHEGCRRQPRLASVVIPGGWFVALSQLAPVLQFGSGIVALHVASLGVARQDVQSGFGELVAFAATLLTGGMLLSAAAVFGILFRLVVPDVERPRDPGKPEVDRDELA